MRQSSREYPSPNEDVAEVVGVALKNYPLFSFPSISRYLLKFISSRLGGGLRLALKLVIVALAVGFLSKSTKKDKKEKKKRVAVVGSGIAGCGAVYALSKSGIDAVVYEKKPTFGGNAKSFTWDIEGNRIRTGLAVLAFPHNLFHNYNELMTDLGQELVRHPLRFLVTETEDQKEETAKIVYAHDENLIGEMPKWVKEDLKKWDKVVAFVNWFNNLFQPSQYESLYTMSFLNPLNLISLKTLMRLFGISTRFWNYVFVPVHTSTFLEMNLDSLPAVMATVLEAAMPFNSTPVMSAWKVDVNDPIQQILSCLPKQNLKSSCGIEKVVYEADGVVKVYDEDDNVEIYDGIIFACSARAMERILQIHNQKNGWGRNFLMNSIESLIFRWTTYSHDRDPTFNFADVHRHASIVPAPMRRSVLDNYCNYIEVDSKDPSVLENSFVISSWAPTIHNVDDASLREMFRTRDDIGMFVSYNAREKLNNKDIDWTSTSREAHPSLTTWHMFATQMLWPMIQGSRNGTTYFCGSSVTPGNGHDLSLLSGIIAACELGAEYPFKTYEARSDFYKLRKMMLRK